MDPIFLTIDDVIEMHADQIDRYGGTHGLRDSIPAMAATYLFHLCQNHAFLDGNKRIGANASITFLFMNGWDLILDEEELVGLVLIVAAGVIEKNRLTTVFLDRCVTRAK